MRCRIEFLRGIQFVESLDGEDNALIDSSNLMTLEGNTMLSFISEVTEVNLTKGKATNLETDRFDQLTKLVEQFMIQAQKDQKRIDELQQQLLKVINERPAQPTIIHTRAPNLCPLM